MLVQRQRLMYGSEMPLWKRYEQACDFLDDDLDSGYVRVLQEMIAAGWSDAEMARRVVDMLRGWLDLLEEVATRGRSALRLARPVHPQRSRRAGGTVLSGR